MALRKLFWLKRDWVTRKWRRLHSEELSDLNSSPNVIRLIKSRDGRRMWSIWGEGFCLRDLMERDHLEDLGVGGDVILK
jgi:hypothetical protein